MFGSDVAKNLDADAAKRGEGGSAGVEIDITEQGWITAGRDAERDDLCSHGDIRLVIGGEVIAPGDGSNNFHDQHERTPASRTLEWDHVSGGQQLILHCQMSDDVLPGRDRLVGHTPQWRYTQRLEVVDGLT